MIKNHLSHSMPINPQYSFICFKCFSLFCLPGADDAAGGGGGGPDTASGGGGGFSTDNDDADDDWHGLGGGGADADADAAAEGGAPPMIASSNDFGEAESVEVC